MQLGLIPGARASSGKQVQFEGWYFSVPGWHGTQRGAHSNDWWALQLV